MMRFFRLALLGVAIYAFYILAFPGWKGSQYLMTTLGLILGAAFILHMALEMFKIGSLIGSIIFEFCFGLGLILYMGWTMPQKSGKTPIQLWAEGHRPTQAAASEGLERLHLNPQSRAGALILGFFPKR